MGEGDLKFNNPHFTVLFFGAVVDTELFFLSSLNCFLLMIVFLLIKKERENIKYICLLL